MKFAFGRSLRSKLAHYPRNVLLFVNVLLLLLGTRTIIEVSQVQSAYRLGKLEIQDAKVKNEKVFIASIHWNNEEILREHWIPAVVNLAQHLGSDNVFVSIQESGSWDGSKDALRMLDMQLKELGIHRKVLLSDITHKDEVGKTPEAAGWIQTPRDQTELRRIPYLARLRNAAMEPLEELAQQGKYYDKILWLNDVVFNPTDIMRLLDTRDGDYAAACALDFSKPPQFYDTFALRDSEGHPALMQTWPYFRSSESRDAIISGAPVPVTSCWNGVVSMDATTFYNSTSPLRFRGISDSLARYHLEGSECCLIHLDNTKSAEHGVWLNPMVRVGYSTAAYQAANPMLPDSCLSVWEISLGLWENWLRRWFTTLWLEKSTIHRRLDYWRAQEHSRAEKGAVCLVDEMQVLIENGWAHV